MLIVDLSSHNKKPDFKTLARHTQGIWFKATEGVTYVNPTYHAWKNEADYYGIRTGAYHFARPQDSATESARRFCQIVTVGRRDLRPVFDCETWDDALTPAQHEMWARTFNNAVKQELRQIPAFYSNPAMVARLNLKEPIGNGLWLSVWGRNDGKDYPFVIPAPWKHVIAHQYSSRATVVGCDGLVDLSYAPRIRGVLAHPILGLL